jgi:hypothetical protein
MLTYTSITGHKSKIIDILSAGHVKVICIYNQLFIFLQYHTDSDFTKDKNQYTTISKHYQLCICILYIL